MDSAVDLCGRFLAQVNSEKPYSGLKAAVTNTYNLPWTRSPTGIDKLLDCCIMRCASAPIFSRRGGLQSVKQITTASTSDFNKVSSDQDLKLQK